LLRILRRAECLANDVAEALNHAEHDASNHGVEQKGLEAAC
jgi:hypothetical protein